MSCAVLLTAAAVSDFEDIYQYVVAHDALGKADHVLTNIEKVFGSLSDNPKRRVYPKELLALGIREFREIFFKPYRVIYRAADDAVYILLIDDGRRDMQTLLQRRLLLAD